MDLHKTTDFSEFWQYNFREIFTLEGSMEEKKTLKELREELHSLIDSLTPEQQERLLRSWEATQELNKIPGHESILYVFLQ